MHIEVDQSGKIGNTKVPTVLAFSNAESYAILIPAAVKRECVKFLRRHYRQLRQPYMKLFAAALFLLLKGYVAKVSLVIVDEEYTGHEGTIKGMLLNHLRRIDPYFPTRGITFQRIGKQSAAHQKAYAVYVGDAEPDHEVRSEELIALLE